MNIEQRREMPSVVGLKLGYKLQRTDTVYCEKINIRVRFCNMTLCEFYEQCGAKLAQSQAKNKYE